MKPTETIHSIESAKVLGDPRRLQILRLLMQGPATLSQLGEELNSHPAKVRHHLKLLEDGGYVKLSSTRIVRGFVEKYYQATSGAYLVNLTILPRFKGDQTIIMMGSHDLAMEVLTREMRRQSPGIDIHCVPIGSLDGLIALRQGLCHIAGCHLSQPSGLAANASYVEHILPGREIALVAIGERQQGILTQKGNPKRIFSLEDLTREDIVFANRQPGSGTRLWLDHYLARSGISPAAINGYNSESNTHHQVGQAIAGGLADVGVGLLAEANMAGLDYVPLFEERYDLVLPAEFLEDRRYLPLFDHLNSAHYRQKAASLGGYSTAKSGEVISVTSF